MRAKSVILSIILLVVGFLIAFSYRYTKEEVNNPIMTDSEWLRNIQLREELNELEEKNLNLQNELYEKQATLFDIEKSLAENEDRLVGLLNEAQNLRMLLGKVKVAGPGIVVSLDDGYYDPLSGDINNFIVHEHHVLKVVNELYISGAEAVAINGQRITANSYIICDGPVITVDGVKFPAPFVVSAIGNSDVLEKSLNFPGGVRDQLVNDNIIFQVEKKATIELEPVFTARN